MSDNKRKVFYLDDRLVITCGENGRNHMSDTPDGVEDLSFGDLLRRLAAQFDRMSGGVLILGERAADRIGWTTAGEDGVPAEGWNVYGKGGWYSYSGQGQPTVRVGIVSRMNEAQRMLLARWPGDTVSRLDRWHHMMGAPFYGNPGTAVTLALKLMSPRGQGTPAWRIKDQPPEWHGVEEDFTAWRPAGDTDAIELVGYDRVRAGLCTWMSMEVCPWTLRHWPDTNTSRDAKKFDPQLAGMWKVTLSPWNVPTMPAPWGPQPHTLEPVWRTTPTLALLTELTEAGLYGGFRVHEAHLGTGRPIFKQWATRIRQAWDLAPYTTPEADEGESAAIRATLKEGYRTAHGMMARESKGGIWRYDWWNTHTALARSIAWRKAWKAHQAGSPPAWWDGDTIGYRPDQLPPAGIYPMRDETNPTMDKLGQWRPVVVVTRDPVVATAMATTGIEGGE